MSASPDPLVLAVRSTRTRIKSQRALDSEFADRLFSKTKDKPVEKVEPVLMTATKKGKTKVPSKRRGKVSKEELFCICRSDGSDARAMIECGDCGDWFHFDCVHLTDQEAERIHKYVCPGCEAKTGEESTLLYDITTFPSPSPPPGVTKAPAKRKFKKKPVQANPKSASNSPEAASESESSSDDEGSEVKGGSGSESSGSAASASSSKRPLAKRPRAKQPTRDIKPKRESVDRKPSISVPPPKPLNEPLPKARQHVQVRMAGVIKQLFEGSMEETEAAAYAVELEGALWASFKEVVNGKEATGSRYKAQFVLLSSSLSRSMRSDLRASVLDRTLGPHQVAVLTPADLASSERLEELERAKQAVLQQTVKSRADVDVAAVRLGRDGFEKMEDRHEKEMIVLAKQEEAARVSEKRRDTLVSQEGSVPVPVMESPRVTREPQSDEKPPVPMLHKRSESIDTAAAHSPTKRTFALTSAWGDAKRHEVTALSFDGDQMALDLSDIVAEPEQVDIKSPAVPEPAKPTEIELFEARPIVWSGGIVNPAAPSPHKPIISARLVATLQPSAPWSSLLPIDSIVITGRVPTDKALRYLSDSRLSPTKELIVVALSLNPDAGDDERKTWEEMVEYHISRDRHGIYLPFGNGRVPPGAAKEVYLVPLRPSDPSPDFTDLIDGYNLPSTRPFHMFLGVFIITKETTTMSPSVSQNSSIMPAPVRVNPPPMPTAAMIENDKLKALMASLNPSALQSILTPVGASIPAPTPPIMTSAQYQPTIYPSYTPPILPQPSQAYNTPYRTPNPRGGSPHQQQGSWDARSRDERSRSPDRSGRGSFGRGGGSGRMRESDNGWASRGRGSSGRY